MKQIVTRCKWCNTVNPLYVKYHDTEWGRPTHDEALLFEMLLLESFQAGLSWECVLSKRENFRKAFSGFDAVAIAAYDDSRVEELMQDAGIIRHRLKIKSAIRNARIFLDIQKEFGTFDAYLRQFTHGEVIVASHRTTSPLSDALSRDLYRRGMRFVGSTIIYSYLQAIGVINSHGEECFLSPAR